MMNYPNEGHRPTASSTYSGVHASAVLTYLEEGAIAFHRQPTEAAPVPRATVLAPIRIELPHIDVVLSLSAESRTLPATPPSAHSSQVAISRDDLLHDPIIAQLTREFEILDDASDGQGVYLDAIRLAVLARWLGLCSSKHATSCDKGSPATLPKWRLKRVTDYVDNNLSEPLTLADLAGIAGLSRMYFAAQFRAATGFRPHEYVVRRRIDRAKVLLTDANETLVNVAFSVGFQTQAHFTTVFKRIVGITPGQWRSLGTQIA